MGEPAFVALSQTLPRLLASAWLALVRTQANSRVCAPIRICCRGRLTNCFGTAGIVRRVFRRATANVDLGGVKIAAGDLVVLMLASANRDPEQFPDPDRLDLARAGTSHVALGTGRNSCVGAAAYPYGRFGGHRSAHNHLFGRTIQQCERMAAWVRVSVSRPQCT